MLHPAENIAGRILTDDWRKYNSREDVVFHPKHMDPEELLAGYRTVVRRFYVLVSIARRLSRSPGGLWWTLPLNCIYHASLRYFAYPLDHQQVRVHRTGPGHQPTS